MSDSVKIFRDIGLTVFSSIISLLLGFILTVVLGRYLGAEDLGLYRLISVIYSMAMLIFALGIPAALIKSIAEHKEDQNRMDSIVSASLVSSLIMGLCCTVFVFISAGALADLFHERGLTSLLVVLAPVFPFSLVGGVLTGYSNGMRTMATYLKATALQSIVMLLVSAALIVCGYGITGPVIGIDLAAVASCLYLAATTKKYYKFTFAGIARATGELVSLGTRILLANGINQINYQADIILIGLFLSATDVAYYSVAVVLSTFIWFIPQGVQTITYPVISEYYSRNNYASLQAIVDKSLKYSACMLVPICLFITFFSAVIIQTIYGQGFLKSIVPLQILVVGTLINGSMQRPIGSILFSLGKPNLNLKIFTFAAAGNILLNVSLIPVMGIAGASIATVFSYLSITILMLYYTIKIAKVRVDFRWFSRLGTLVIALLIAGYAGAFFNQAFVSIVLITLSVVAIWSWFLLPEDRSFLLDRLKSCLALSRPDAS